MKIGDLAFLKEDAEFFEFSKANRMFVAGNEVRKDYPIDEEFSYDDDPIVVVIRAFIIEDGDEVLKVIDNNDNNNKIKYIMWNGDKEGSFDPKKRFYTAKENIRNLISS